MVNEIDVSWEGEEVVSEDIISGRWSFSCFLTVLTSLTSAVLSKCLDRFDA